MVVCSKCAQTVGPKDLPPGAENYSAPGLVAYLTLEFDHAELLELLGQRVGFSATESGYLTKDRLAETLVLILALEGEV
jgi:hypothetical protein